MTPTILRLIVLGLVGIFAYSEGYYNAYEELGKARGRVGIITMIPKPDGTIFFEGDPKVKNDVYTLLVERYNLQPLLDHYKENQWIFHNVREPRWPAP